MPVRPDGMISLPLVGDIDVAGKSADELRRELKRTFSRYVRYPVVLVTVSEFDRPSSKVYVLGQITRPGAYLMGREENVIDAMMRAEGATPYADLENVFLLRQGEVVAMDLGWVRGGGVPTTPASLESGDTLYIPKRLDGAVYVLGEVHRPGMVQCGDELSLVEAISHAGGFSKDAKLKELRVVRGGFANPTVIAVNMKDYLRGRSTAGVELMPGDVVYAPPKKGAKFRRGVSNVTPIIQQALQALIVSEAINDD